MAGCRLPGRARDEGGGFDHRADEGLSVSRGPGRLPGERPRDRHRPLLRGRLAGTEGRRVGLPVRRPGAACDGEPGQRRRRAVHGRGGAERRPARGHLRGARPRGDRCGPRDPHAAGDAARPVVGGPVRRPLGLRTG